MPQHSYENIESLLSSPDPANVLKGLHLARIELRRGGDRQRLTEILVALFYIDPLDRPDLVPAVEEAVELISGLGAPAIPHLLEILDAGDMKAQIMVGQTLGRMGAEAIAPLIAEYHDSQNPTRRALILYALGKIKSPEILHAAHIALDAAASADAELRDTAARAIGKFAEAIPAGFLPEELRLRFLDRLYLDALESNPSLRAKAIRSLGKLARHGHMTDSEREKLSSTCRGLLGKDEAHTWDRAYIVRKEAAEAEHYCGNRLLVGA